MKNLFFLTVATLIATNAIAAESLPGSNIIAQEFSNFILLEKRHCDDWLEFKLRKETRCIDLAISQKEESTNFKSSFIKQAGRGKITKADLDEAIELHKKHKAEHRKLAESIYKEKISIMNAHDEELEAFEKNPNVIPQTKIAAEITRADGNKITR
jgi:hypothetical protein